MLQRQDGQILPGLVVLLGVTLSLGVLFFQIGKASVLRSDAQNAADAAALAGAQEIQRQLAQQYALLGYTDPSLLDEGAVIAKMREYADKNGGVLVDQDPNMAAVDVRAWAKSKRELGEDAKPADSQDVRGAARARAQVQLGAFSIGSPTSPAAPQGGVPGGGIPKITDEEWKELKKEIGPEPRDCPDVISLGLLMVRKGFMVWQNAHPQLGGYAGHENNPSSNHHACNGMGALDVNHGPPGNFVPVEMAAIDPLIAPLHELGYSTIWMDTGHYNHLHVDIGGGGGAYNLGGGGFAGPLDHTTLEIRLVDWETPVAPDVNLGGNWPTTKDLYGPPDVRIMQLMCQMARPYGPKILLATFETAIVESGIHNLDWGDRESHGVFQQQHTQGWGSLADTMHPPTATRMFLDEALRVSRMYPNLSAGQLAAKVQRPREDLEYRYDEEEPQARRLIARHCG